MVQIIDEIHNQVSFIKPHWKVSSRYLRLTPVSQIGVQPGQEVLGTLVNPALRVTETEWVSHNVMPGEDTSEPVMVRGRLGSGKFGY